jgi:hypothetical protein
MAYFKEFPLVEYPSRFIDQSSNEDYTLVRNIFRRAKLREDAANAATAFTYYQIKEGERPDQIAERLYENSSLDWVILITNNITDVVSQWPLSGQLFYEYLIDKYNDEDTLDNIKYLETVETRDEFDRLVIPEKLKTEGDTSQGFTTIDKEVDPLFYDLEFYPIPSKYRDLKVTSNLFHYLEIWERGNLGEGQEYEGEEYKTDKIFLQSEENPKEYNITDRIFPNFSRTDFSYMFVYGRQEEIKYVYSPITLQGWPGTWGGEIPVYQRDETTIDVSLIPILGENVDITDDTRLYTITSVRSIGDFDFTPGTILLDEANQTYTIEDPETNLNGRLAKFEIRRNSSGQIITVDAIDGGRDYAFDELITIPGSSIGGVDIIDDIQIRVTEIFFKPQFRFISIG